MTRLRNSRPIVGASARLTVDSARRPTLEPTIIERAAVDARSWRCADTTRRRSHVRHARARRRMIFRVGAETRGGALPIRLVCRNPHARNAAERARRAGIVVGLQILASADPRKDPEPAVGGVEVVSERSRVQWRSGLLRSWAIRRCGRSPARSSGRGQPQRRRWLVDSRAGNGGCPRPRQLHTARAGQEPATARRRVREATRTRPGPHVLWRPRLCGRINIDCRPLVTRS